MVESLGLQTYPCILPFPGCIHTAATDPFLKLSPGSRVLSTVPELSLMLWEENVCLGVGLGVK